MDSQEETKDIITTKHSALTLVTNPYLALATSKNTRKAYRSDINHYEISGGKLPATPEMIAHYLNQFADKLNPRTLARRIIALKNWHTYQGFPDPTLHPAISKTMTGIARRHGKPKIKARAITPDELALMINTLKREDSLIACRDNALLQIGFFGALRRSELVSIHVEHITWKEEGIEIVLPSSKTDQTHEGQYCAIPYGTESLCAVQALKHWLTFANIHHGAVFRRILHGDRLGDRKLTPFSVNHILKARAAAAGFIDTTQISSHSLRRGLATSAAKAVAPIQAMMRAGRWKQVNTVMEYIEASERFSDNAATSVLHVFKNSSKQR